jgi:hypothetical protein
MHRTVIVLLALACCAFAQGPADVSVPAPMQAGAIAVSMAGGGPISEVKGAPYSATLTNESVQTLSDGTHITQSSTGSAARDSQGRTRQDAPLPMLGGLAPSDAPRLVMIHDPVAGVAYTLNYTNKTAWKHGVPALRTNVDGSGVTSTTKTIVVRTEGAGPGMPAGDGPATMLPGQNVFFQKRFVGGEVGEVKTEDLGSQVIEGVQATGVRTTETIAAGKIGNDRPISIVTEVWTSPELHTIVLSKRSDPRTGEQTFKLTNIQRGEPDPSLFTVPSDFKLSDNGPETFVYREKH